MNDLSLVGSSFTQAQLPQIYTAARAALFRCDQIDECRQWVNKAAALASYALQARDQSLRSMADRIQARAVRRCGELLNQEAEPAKKMALAESYGLDRKQYEQAVAVAKVPLSKFEQAIEADEPPKVYKLAQMGAKKRATKPIQKNSKWIKQLERLSDFCQSVAPQDIADEFYQWQQAKFVHEWLGAILETPKAKDRKLLTVPQKINWRDGMNASRELRNCMKCGGAFHFHISKSKNSVGAGKYCSRKCAGHGEIGSANENAPGVVS